MAKLLSNAMFCTSFCASLSQHNHQPKPPVFNSSPSSSSSITTVTATERDNKPNAHPAPNLPQTLTHEQNPINQQPIGRPLDLKIPKERIRPKQTEYFIKRIVALAVRLGALRCGDLRGVQGGQSVGGAAGACAQGEEWEVAYEAHVGLGVED
jgi:hypothetical protein